MKYIVGVDFGTLSCRAVLVTQNGDLVDCPDYNTIQKEVSMTMVVEEPLAEPMMP